GRGHAIDAIQFSKVALGQPFGALLLSCRLERGFAYRHTQHLADVAQAIAWFQRREVFWLGGKLDKRRSQRVLQDAARGFWLAHDKENHRVQSPKLHCQPAYLTLEIGAQKPLTGAKILLLQIAERVSGVEAVTVQEGRD